MKYFDFNESILFQILLLGIGYNLVFEIINLKLLIS